MSNLQFLTHNARPERLHDNMVEKVFELLATQVYDTVAVPPTPPLVVTDANNTNGISNATVTGKSVSLYLDFIAGGGGAVPLTAQLLHQRLYPAVDTPVLLVDPLGGNPDILATVFTTGAIATVIPLVAGGGYTANVAYGGLC